MKVAKQALLAARYAKRRSGLGICERQFIYLRSLRVVSFNLVAALQTATERCFWVSSEGSCCSGRGGLGAAPSILSFIPACFAPGERFFLRYQLFST